jgi:hypothetical protein
MNGVASVEGITAARPAQPGQQGMTHTLRQLRAMSFRGLARMYSPADHMFVFCVRRTPSGTNAEGLSPRYTAITLIGLAGEREADIARVLGPDSPELVLRTLIDALGERENLGDIALAAFAASLMKSTTVATLIERVARLGPADQVHPVVEVAWALTAMSETSVPEAVRLRPRIAERLMAAFNPQSELFPHMTGKPAGARSHVACFADLIYPIQALSKYAAATGDARALEVASRAARRLCSLQGSAGQWWWHYDHRSGQVIEGYPVYAIHQDAMGPMGLFALFDAGGADCRAEIRRGLEWLASAPELNGGSLVDHGADLIWRKVARHEPRKAVRYLQGAASRIHAGLRVPGVDAMFPSGAIDFEDRPYHLGWLLYAWPESRVASWQTAAAPAVRA